MRSTSTAHHIGAKAPTTCLTSWASGLPIARHSFPHSGSTFSLAAICAEVSLGPVKMPHLLCM
ncbi:MAG: hypothetical protein ACYDC5_00010 [Candidatus Dormibacteria bacterium]